MAKVAKENRVQTVQDDMVPMFLADGYNQIDNEGNVIKRATGGKVIPLNEHNRVLDEVESLKQKVKDMQEEIKVLEEENIRLDKLAKQNSNKGDRHFNQK
jgi:cell shape-determining protein MreC